MIIAVVNAICAIAERSLKKNSGLQRGLNQWPRDYRCDALPLSYEAPDIGSRSIVGSYVHVSEMNVNDMWNKSYMNCGSEMKWRNDHRSCERNLGKFDLLPTLVAS